MAATSSEQKESTKFSTCLGNEELTLELDQTGQFIIELANASRFVVYTKVIIKQDEVREITGGFVDSPALLYDSLCMLLREKSTFGSVEFNEKSSTLVVNTKLILVPVTWNIPMKRIESATALKCQFLEKQVEQLTDANKALTDRMKFLEEQIGFGEPKKVESPIFAAVTVPNFTISADRKTVNADLYATWHGFLSEHSLTAMGNKFTVCLNNIGTSLMVGVARRGTDPKNGLSYKTSSWMLCINGGSTYQFYSNGAGATVTTRIAVANGSQLTVRLDILNEQLYFKINGNLLYTADIPKPFSDLYAAVDLNYAYQSIGFV